MGARTDFVRAMLFGVIVGVAITTAFFQLRKSDCPAPAPAPAPAPQKSSSSIAPPSPTATTTVPALPADAATVAVAQQIEDKLGTLGVPSNLVQVACKSACCEVSIDDGAYEEHADDIKRALDIAPGTAWQSRKAGTIRVIEKCW